MKTKLILATTLVAIVAIFATVLALAASNETFVVTPVTPLGWTFQDDNGNGDLAHGFVVGPFTPPAGTGSYRLAVSASNQGTIFYNSIYQNTKFVDITQLKYSTFQTSNPGGVTAISLQLTGDNDLTDGDTGFKGRLVFEPYQGQPSGTVQTGQWQTWNPMNGLWWGTGSNPVTRPFGNLCPQSSPCTWPQVLAYWPNGGIHALDPHAIIFKAGSGWTSFDGNVDKFTIGINDGQGGEDIATYDFNLHSAPADPDQCKNGGWKSFNPPSGPYKNQGQCVSSVVKNTGGN